MNPKDFSDILELSKNSGGKYVIVENGQPSYVIMDIKEYKKMVSHSDNIAIEDMSKEELVEKINNDIAIWHASQNEEEKVFDDQLPVDDLADRKEKDETQYLYEELNEDF